MICYVELPRVNKLNSFMMILDNHKWKNRTENLILHDLIFGLHVEHYSWRNVSLVRVRIAAKRHFRLVYESDETSFISISIRLLGHLTILFKILIVLKMTIIDDSTE